MSCMTANQSLSRCAKHVYTIKDKNLACKGGMESSVPSYRVQLTMYSDSDWAMGAESRIQATLFIYTKYIHPIVTAFSTDAVDIAVIDACNDGLSICCFLRGGWIAHAFTPSIICMDNQGTIFMTSNLVTNNRSKHMIQEYIVKGLFNSSMLASVSTLQISCLMDWTTSSTCYL